MRTKPVVQFKNIKKKIGKKMIIDDISFEVNAGEIFGFLGPNGGSSLYLSMKTQNKKLMYNFSP